MRIKKILSSAAFKISAGAALLAIAIAVHEFSRPSIAVIIYAVALLVCGFDVFISAVRGLLRRDIFDEKLLMSIASVGAMIIGEYTEAVAVMLFFLVGESFEHRAVRRSRDSIRSLMDIYPDEACILRDGEELRVSPDDVEVGTTVIIRPGERVPIDCRVISGSADVDTSPMTGESIPRAVAEGTLLDSGCIVISGMLRCVSIREADESAAARILELVESANENKSRQEQFITKFSRYYTPVVVIAAVLLATLPSIFGITSWGDSVYRALTFLVISCPCALVISVPMAFFGGIGGAASRGILYKGGNVFSAAARADTVVFDKTGTLTCGKFSISSFDAISVDGRELISLAASAEYASNHPIAACIREAADAVQIPESAEEIAGEGVMCKIGDDSVGVGNAALMARLGVNMSDAPCGVGAVYVAKNARLAGVIYISDSIKAEVQDALAALRDVGIKHTAILSGDRRENVARVGEELKIDTAIAVLTPGVKYAELERLISLSRTGVMYVGDGINDAPSLARADVGISMGTIGQDSAIEASDIVIMTDNLSKIAEAVKIARKTVGIAKQNIVFALGVKGAVLVLGALGIANMWLAVFADVGVAVLAILNSMRALVYSGTRKTKG